MQKQILYLMDQNRVLSCFDAKSGHLPIKKNEFFEIMSLYGSCCFFKYFSLRNILK
jgi:hypothetical protein